MKFLSAGVVGYFVGKASYAMECKEKILRQAPDSEMAKYLQRRTGRGVTPEEGDPHQDDYSYFASAQEPQQQKKADTEVTYDALREQHRAKYRMPLEVPPSSSYEPKIPQPLPPVEGHQQDQDFFGKSSRPPTKSTNKYGDEGFE